MVILGSRGRNRAAGFVTDILQYYAAGLIRRRPEHLTNGNLVVDSDPATNENPPTVTAGGLPGDLADQGQDAAISPVSQ